LGVLIYGGLGALFGYSLAEKNVASARSRTVAGFAALGSGFGILAGFLSGEKDKDEIIQIEGKSKLESMLILRDLSSKARIRNF
jgi:hypothetical protein